MSFHNVPPNGFPDLPDVEELEAVVKDVTGLKADKAAKTDIAPAFSATSNYAVGDMVYHDGTLYVCSTAHAAAAWDANDFTATSVASELSSVVGDIGDLTTTKANQITIAPFFNPETAYEAGDLVYYNGLTYRCVNAHEGEWDADDFAATTIANELSSLESGLTGVTGNDIGPNGYDDISATTSETAYVCPCDGYLYASSETDTTGTIRVVVLGAVSLTPIGYIYMNVSDEYQIQTLLLRKGMKVFVSNRTANAIVRFNKLTVGS